MNLRKLGLTLVAGGFLLAMTSVPASAQLVAFNQAFCGNWNFGNSTQAGSSSELLLNGANSSGNAYQSGPCSMPMNQDGTYTWDVHHGTVNTTTHFGTEHGQFTFTGSGSEEGQNLGAIFDGQITMYKPMDCSKGQCMASAQCTDTVYTSLGNWNSIQNNPATDLSSTFHSNGTYAVTVTSDDSGHCDFDAELQPH